MTQNKGRLSAEEWDLFVARIEPTDIDLMAAPVLDDWRVMHRRGVPCAFGRVTDHPQHGTGHLTTSEVLRIADDESWLRTRNRFYRLGRRYVHRTTQEIAEQVMGERTSERSGPWAPHPGFQARDHFPDLPLPPMEDDQGNSLPQP
ncbi:hypothetical protein ILT44_04425 [Microvirga sp. BT689]|uniref:DUF6634 family protein n=1 Tax=Microvirga arvi TaxID=2778731 RepID=UPI001951D94D|nr:DUF6634 family protein [Microvirga arvi]MBM6579420.1 hypothetical protein [Microvirga arvi]